MPEKNPKLLYVKNTTGHVFKSLDDQRIYVPISGRRFRSKNESGPWEFVPGKSLSPEFAKIADDSPEENVKASVPGTPQAQEAVISSGIPQSAKVERNKARNYPSSSGSRPWLKVQCAAVRSRGSVTT